MSGNALGNLAKGQVGSARVMESIRVVKLEPEPLRPFEIDVEKISVMVISRYKKQMRLISEIEDEEESMMQQCEVLSTIVDNWTAQEISDLPTYRFLELIERVREVFQGQLPKGSIGR